MATFHISQDEAKRDFDGLMDRVRNGDEVVIEENAATVAVMKPAGEHVRLLSDSIRMLKERGSTVTLDDEFGRDLEEIINLHREPMFGPDYDPWA
jgi:antitoxin (DNA-binding transcriptional repressor) of toxin-antitoxin stability system